MFEITKQRKTLRRSKVFEMLTFGPKSSHDAMGEGMSLSSDVSSKPPTWRTCPPLSSHRFADRVERASHCFRGLQHVPTPRAEGSEQWIIRTVFRFPTVWIRSIESRGHGVGALTPSSTNHGVFKNKISRISIVEEKRLLFCVLGLGHGGEANSVNICPMT